MSVYCNFPPHIATNKVYTCYKKETCCDQGCCINGPYQFYQVWYYWLLVLLVLGIISGSSWLCKKPQPVQSRSNRNVRFASPGSQSYALTRCTRRNCHRSFSNVNDVNDSGSDSDIILDRLFVSFRNRHAMGDPPSYSSILPMECSAIHPKFCPLYSYYGPPPTYSSVYKLTDNAQMPASTSTAPECVTQIQVHAEENSASGSGEAHTVSSGAADPGPTRAPPNEPPQNNTGENL